MSEAPHRWWVDGALCSVDVRQLSRWEPTGPDRSSYTTARVSGGVARWHDRHVRRLQRDGAQLGLGEISAEAVEAAFRETGRANFGAGEGVVRLQLELDGRGGARLVGIPRAIGPEAATWTAVTAHFPHDGPTKAPGAKLAGRALFAEAHALSNRLGVDETLLVDAEGFLIEGARANLCVVADDGRLAAPDLRRGGVAGIAREILCELLPEVEVRDIRADELANARELVATNAVRCGCPIVQLDGKPVGSGRPGPAAERIAEMFRTA